MDSGPAAPDGTPDADEYPGPGAVSWGPAPWLAGLSFVIMLAALVWHFLAHDPEDRLVAVAFAVVAALAGLTLLRLRTRLTAGPRGLVIRELLSTRRVGWSEIRSANLESRGRLGARNQALEIDLLDDSLYVFGRFDLGATPAEVRRELVRQRGAPLPG